MIVGYVVSYPMDDDYRPRFPGAPGKGHAWTAAPYFTSIRKAEAARADIGGELWPVYLHQNGNKRRGRHALSPTQIQALWLAEGK